MEGLPRCSCISQSRYSIVFSYLFVRPVQKSNSGHTPCILFFVFTRRAIIHQKYQVPIKHQKISPHDETAQTKSRRRCYLIPTITKYPPHATTNNAVYGDQIKELNEFHFDGLNIQHPQYFCAALNASSFFHTEGRNTRECVILRMFHGVSNFSRSIGRVCIWNELFPPHGRNNKQEDQVNILHILQNKKKDSGAKLVAPQKKEPSAGESDGDE